MGFGTFCGKHQRCEWEAAAKDGVEQCPSQSRRRLFQSPSANGADSQGRRASLCAVFNADGKRELCVSKDDDERRDDGSWIGGQTQGNCAEGGAGCRHCGSWCCDAARADIGLPRTVRCVFFLGWAVDLFARSTVEVGEWCQQQAVKACLSFLLFFSDTFYTMTRLLQNP